MTDPAVQHELVGIDETPAADDRTRFTYRPGETTADFTHRQFDQLHQVLDQAKENHACR